MNSFDDLLNTEILTELGTGGLRDAIATKVVRKVGGIPDAIKAKAGSKAAKGRNNLRDMIQHLEDEFKVFCGEQSLRVADTAVEDFLEFLRHRVHFNITDDNFDRLAYGPHQDAPDAGKIGELEEQIQKAIELSKSFDPQILELAGYAGRNDGNSILARKTLWKLARANPSQAKAFSKVQRYIGRPLGPMFKRLVQQIAQLIIKIGDRNYAQTAADQDKAAADAEAAEPMNLNVGDQRAPSPAMFQRKRFDYQFLSDELGKLGLAAKVAKHIAETLGDSAIDDEEEVDGCQKRIKAIKRENGINIIRILLQLFRGGYDREGHVRKYVFRKIPKLEQALAGSLMQGRGTKTADKDEDGLTIYTYNGTEFNKRLVQAIPDALTAQAAIVLLLGCLGKR